MCVSIVTGSLSQYSVPFRPFIDSFSSLYIYPTLYPNPMKQTAARYFPFSFVFDVFSCPGPRPFARCSSLPAAKSLRCCIRRYILRRTRTSLRTRSFSRTRSRSSSSPRRLSTVPRSRCLRLATKCVLFCRCQSQFYFPFVDMTPSFLFLPMQSNLLDDLRRLLDRSVSQALTESELEQVRADDGSNE